MNEIRCNILLDEIKVQNLDPILKSVWLGPVRLRVSLSGSGSGSGEFLARLGRVGSGREIKCRFGFGCKK